MTAWPDQLPPGHRHAWLVPGEPCRCGAPYRAPAKAGMA
jgi:hypothetical protein